MISSHEDLKKIDTFFTFLGLNSHARYIRVNEQIEKWNKLIFTSVLYSNPAIFLCKIFLSYYFFLTDHGTDSFNLIFPMS